MPLLLASILIGFPVLDIASLIAVGGRIGLWPTVGLVIAGFFIGSALLRSQSFALLQQAQKTLQEGRFPAREVFDGACVLLGGLLLLFPGFASDIVGIALLIPQVRALLRRAIGAHVQRSGGIAMWTTGTRPSAPAGDSKAGPVIEGEYRPVADEAGSGAPSAQETSGADDTPPGADSPSSPWTHRSSTAVVRSRDP